jgi:hypothetical protein
MLALFSVCDPLHRIVDGSVLKIPNGLIALVTLNSGVRSTRAAQERRVEIAGVYGGSYIGASDATQRTDHARRGPKIATKNHVAVLCADAQVPDAMQVVAAIIVKCVWRFIA